MHITLLLGASFSDDEKFRCKCWICRIWVWQIVRVKLLKDKSWFINPIVLFLFRIRIANHIPSRKLDGVEFKLIRLDRIFF